MASKHEERVIVQALRSVLPDFPPGDILDHEEPDFLIGGPPGVGIELTGYVEGQGGPHGSGRLRDEMLRRQIAARARSIFESGHSERLWVTLHWWRTLPRGLKGTDVQPLAAALSEVVQRRLQDARHDHFLIEPEELESTRLREWVHRVSVGRLQSGRRGGWAAVQAGFFGIDANDLRPAIEPKEANSQHTGTTAVRSGCWFMPAAQR